MRRLTLALYFSETTDGDFEEAFRLCPCNYKPEAAQEGADYYYHEEPKGAKNILREKPTSPRLGMIEVRVELW